MGRHTLSAAALAQHSQVLAAPDGERDPVDGLNKASVRSKVGFEIPHFEKDIVIASAGCSNGLLAQ
jgi:hypothetical protein